MVADGKRLFEPLVRSVPALVAEDKADARFVSVAAASLCAKVRRDELWLAICERYRPALSGLLEGMAGGGYVNEATRRFLRAYAEKYGRLPEEGLRGLRSLWPICWEGSAACLTCAAGGVASPTGVAARLRWQGRKMVLHWPREYARPRSDVRSACPD